MSDFIREKLEPFSSQIKFIKEEIEWEEYNGDGKKTGNLFVERPPEYADKIQEGTWITDDFKSLVPVGYCRNCKAKIEPHEKQGFYYTTGIRFVKSARNGYCEKCCVDEWDNSTKYVPTRAEHSLLYFRTTYIEYPDGHKYVYEENLKDGKSELGKASR